MSKSTSGKWLSVWIDSRQANHRDNTHTLLLIDRRWAAMGSYTESAGVDKGVDLLWLRDRATRRIE